MRAYVCVVALTISAGIPLTGCSSVDSPGEVANPVFAGGKFPVQAENMSPESQTAAPVAIAAEPTAGEAEPSAVETDLQEPPKKQYPVVRRQKSAPSDEPRRAALTPPPAQPAPAKPAAAKPAGAAPAAAAQAPAGSVPAAPAAAKPAAAKPASAKPAAVKPAAVEAAQAPAAGPPRVTSEGVQLTTPWPDAPRSGTFSH